MKDLIRPFSKTPRMSINSRKSSYGDVGVAVYFTHFGCRFCPISFRVLNDAEGINSEIADSELARDSHGILKDLGSCPQSVDFLNSGKAANVVFKRGILPQQ